MGARGRALCRADLRRGAGGGPVRGGDGGGACGGRGGGDAAGAGLPALRPDLPAAAGGAGGRAGDQPAADRHRRGAGGAGGDAAADLLAHAARALRGHGRFGGVVAGGRARGRCRWRASRICWRSISSTRCGWRWSEGDYRRRLAGLCGADGGAGGAGGGAVRLAAPGRAGERARARFPLSAPAAAAGVRLSVELGGLADLGPAERGLLPRAVVLLGVPGARRS